MNFIGDIHGNIQKYFDIIKDLDSSIQVGDFGFGFPQVPNNLSFPFQHRFIRGNHDNPYICKQHANYLGDFGYLEKEEIFFVSGAFSIDRSRRKLGKDYWIDEELNDRQFYDCLNLYERIEPKIVVSHDAPEVIVELFSNYPAGSRTQMFLNAIIRLHEPELWIFGHHHKSKEIQYGKTQFISLASGQVFNSK